MFENLRADFQAAMGDRKMEKGLWRVLLHVEMPALLCYRFGHWVENLRVPVVRHLLLIPALVWQRFNQLFLGVFISRDAEIGKGMVIHTPQGLYIPPIKIGEGATFQSGVLIGSGCRGVGDNVYFGSGCKIVGDAKIGNNVVIVANSVVITDVPDNTTIMGVPARIKLPGGKPRRFPWRAGQVDAKPNGGAPNGNGNGSAPKIRTNEAEKSENVSV
jgi:serine O-acetyltransferase